MPRRQAQDGGIADRDGVGGKWRGGARGGGRLLGLLLDSDRVVVVLPEHTHQRVSATQATSAVASPRATPREVPPRSRWPARQ